MVESLNERTMKQSTKFAALLGTAVFLLTACSDRFLDQEPFNNSIQETQYFTTLDQCNTSTQVCYRYIDYDAWWQTQNWRYLAGEAASDNAWIGNTYQSTHATWDAVAHYTLDAGNDRNEGHWIMTYKSIGIFNKTMEGIAAAPIEEGPKAQFIAELKFLRAFMYFDLVRNWGGVPLVLESYPPDTHLPRSTAEEVYEQLVADLQACAEVLPEKSEYPASDKFRASRGAALALLAKVYLYMENWTGAEEAAGQVMASGEYELEPFFGDVWEIANRNGEESIFEIQASSLETPPVPGNGYVVVMNSTADAGWGYISVSSHLENAFKSEGDSIRLQWTINRHGLPVAGDLANPSFDGRPYTDSKSGRFSRKHYTPRAERPANNKFDRNHIILRLADVILIHAEACAMQQKTAEALASLQRIRERVDLSTDGSLSGWNLIQAVRKERRLETALEGDRLYDLRRWKDQGGKPVINSVMGPGGSFVVYNTEESTDPYETANTIEPQNKGANFRAGVHNLWPIPNSQIVASEGVVSQNTGY